MSFWHYALLFLSVVLGGIIAFILKKSDKKVLQIILSFSGAYILGITVLHFLPTVFKGESSNTIGLFILLGFFIQLILEQLSMGVEHGHIHAAHKGKTMFAFQIMIGLCVHAFIEGLPLDSYPSLAHEHIGHSDTHTHGANHLLYSIILHKIPAAFALVILLMVSKFRQSTIIFCLLLFASMSPLGSLIGGTLDLDAQMIRNLLAVVVGSFLHIATTIIFEVDSTHHHSFSISKMAAILGGMGLALVSML